MNTINLDFNKLILYKKRNFFVKKVFFVKHIKFSCFLKQNYVTNKKKIHTYYYNLFKQIENLFGCLPNISYLDLKYTNKKKKLKTKLFFKVDIKTERKNVFFFLEILVIKYFYFFLKNLEKIKLKKFNMLKETLNNKIYHKIKINKNFLNFNILFLKNFLNFGKKLNKKKKRSLFLKKYKIKNKFVRNSIVKFKVMLNSNFINYFFKLLKLIVLNNFKLKIFMHKKYVKYKKIFEKA